MANTPITNMTQLASGQAGQITAVNNNQAIIDALFKSSVADKDLTAPPGSPSAGDSYIVGTSATGDWASQDGKLAYYNNGWKFINPWFMLTVHVVDEDLNYVYNGTGWVPLSMAGVETTGEFWYPFRREITETAISGASVTTSLQALDRELIFAVHTRVTTAITGATSFSVGVLGDTSKFGSSIGIALDSTNIGVGTPTPYFTDTDILLTPSGGSFTGGDVKLVLHGMKFRGPWNF